MHGAVFGIEEGQTVACSVGNCLKDVISEICKSDFIGNLLTSSGIDFSIFVCAQYNETCTKGRLLIG